VKARESFMTKDGEASHERAGQAVRSTP